MLGVPGKGMIQKSPPPREKWEELGLEEDPVVGREWGRGMKNSQRVDGVRGIKHEM